MLPFEIGPSVAVQVQARLGGGEETLVGIPLDLTSSSVAVVFPDDARHSLPGITEQVHLTFSGSALAVPFECPAYTIYRASLAGVTRLRFRVSAAAKKSLRKLPFRREAYRALLDSTVPTFVEVEDVRRSDHLWAELNDVSLGGLSFVVTEIEDPCLLPGTDLRLAFSLPDMAQQLDLVGTVRYHKPVADGVQYGIRFDFEATEHPVEVRDVLTEYILARQLQVLQILNSGRGA